MKPARTGIITLLTDFGDTDGYVGAMKGVIATTWPQARIVDISHRITPFFIVSAAFVLKTYAPHFPPGTVHTAVVDPGVGGDRKCIAASAGGRYYVGPDNGIFSFIFKENDDYVVHAIENAKYMRAEVSDTFHGRDIFAPASAHLARGAKLADFGPRVDEPLFLHEAFPASAENAVEGKIIHIDSFGNLITNITREHLGGFDGGTLAIRSAGRTIIGLSGTYGEREPGELIFYFGSSGHLELAAVEQNASFTLKAGIGDSVRVVTKRGRGRRGGGEEKE